MYIEAYVDMSYESIKHLTLALENIVFVVKEEIAEKIQTNAAQPLLYKATSVLNNQ